MPSRRPRRESRLAALFPLILALGAAGCGPEIVLLGHGDGSTGHRDLFMKKADLPTVGGPDWPGPSLEQVVDLPTGATRSDVSPAAIAQRGNLLWVAWREPEPPPVVPQQGGGPPRIRVCATPCIAANAYTIHQEGLTGGFYVPTTAPDLIGHNDMLVAVWGARDLRIASSPDGMNWTQHTAKGFGLDRKVSRPALAVHNGSLFAAAVVSRKLPVAGPPSIKVFVVPINANFTWGAAVEAPGPKALFDRGAELASLHGMLTVAWMEKTPNLTINFQEKVVFRSTPVLDGNWPGSLPDMPFGSNSPPAVPQLIPSGSGTRIFAYFSNTSSSAVKQVSTSVNLTIWTVSTIVPRLFGVTSAIVTDPSQ